MMIFVVNLDKDKARFAHFSAQMTAAQLPFERMPGVYGKMLTPEELRIHYDDKKAKWRQSRALSSAEIGCSLSHLKIYREIIRRATPIALVLEDDVIVPKCLHAVLEYLEERLSPESPTVILLSEAQTIETSDEELPSGHRLRPMENGYYTSSYVVTQAAAAALLDELHPVGDVADCWGRLAHYQLLDIRAVSPPLVLQDQTAFGSSTTAAMQEVLGNSPLAMTLYKARRLRTMLWDVLSQKIPTRRNHSLVSDSHPIDALFG